ncbi:MAG: DUF4163 domain-containing protein [Leptospiraceae bacterium]|nr:DUF4163 domain-containing protein [Leptospiraceae bacterium]MCP5511264.1 DUF4163 domain-containing protein [Leptospiraceae bacterium]
MKYSIQILLVFCFVFSISIHSDEVKIPFTEEFVEISAYSASKNIRNCSIRIKYPRLVKSKVLNSGIMRKINRTLKKEFLDIQRYDNEYQCNPSAGRNDPAFYLEVKYEIKYNRGPFLSVFYSAVGYLAGAPHPENVFKTFNFDLKTGHQILYEDFFDPTMNYPGFVDNLVYGELFEMGVLSSQEEFNEVKKRRYDYYFDSNKLVLINLYSIHAMQSLEVQLPYEKLMSVLNKKRLHILPNIH